MEKHEIIRLGLILAINTEVEGMKVCNQDTSYLKKYAQIEFEEKASEIRKILRASKDELESIVK